MLRAGPRIAVVILTGLLAACSSGDPAPKTSAAASPAPPAPCKVDLLAGWKVAGLAVLWAGPGPGELSRGQDSEGDAWVSLPSAITAIDIHTGEVRSYCPLPEPAADATPAASPAAPDGVVQSPDVFGMQQDGADYPEYRADIDLMLRTQYFSPDFRWFAAPGLPLVDVATGRQLRTDWTGEVAGLGRGVALLRDGATWCTRSLPPKAGEACQGLVPPSGAGRFAIGTENAPVWVPAAVRPFAFGPVTGYAVTDGNRLYNADYRSLADRRQQRDKLRATDPPIDLDPSGRGGFVTMAPVPPGELANIDGWFTVESAGGDRIETRYHRSQARTDGSWMWGGASNRSRAIVDGGRVAITTAFRPASPDGKQPAGTRFGAVIDQSIRAYDLSQDRGLACPRPGSFCRILTWPDNSLAGLRGFDNAENAAAVPSPRLA